MIHIADCMIKNLVKMLRYKQANMLSTAVVIEHSYDSGPDIDSSNWFHFHSPTDKPQVSTNKLAEVF